VAVLSLNERQRKLAGVLLQSPERVTIRALAERLRVSQRTVRYDLDSLESWLEKRNVNLIRKPNQGIWLEGDPELLCALQHELGPTVSYDCSLSPKERQQLLAALLLRSDRPLTAEELADRLMVSRATVVSDLQKVRSWFAERGISLHSKPNVGYYQESSEKDWRRAVSDLLAGSAGEEHLIRYLTEMSSGSGPWRREGPDGGIMLVLTLFRELNLTELEKIVAEVCGRNGLALNDSSVVGLVIHLALAITRLKQGKDIVMLSPDLDEIKESPEFGIAGEVALAVREQYKVEMPPAEIGYISLHLMGAKLCSYRKKAYKGHDGKADGIKVLATQFIRRAETLLGVELSTDTQLLDGLTIHLQPVQARVKFGLPFRNPLLDEIKQKFSFLFFVAKQASRTLEDAWGNNLPEEEIGYLTLHLGAAVERLKTRYRARPRALVVCGSGVGTSQLIASVLESEIPEIELVGFSSVFCVAQQVKSLQPDLVLSTVPIKNCGVQTIVLSSIPTSQEIKELRAALGFGSSEPGVKQKEGLESKHGFSGGTKPVLSDVLVAETIALDVEAKDWEEGVRLAGGLLVRSGSIEERYVDSMIKAVQELGPYIVIAPGIAMPHARPEDGARKIGLSLVRLKNPVSFGNPTNDPVDLIIGLSAVDSDSHLKLLAQLSKLVNNPNRLKVIREAGSKEGILALVSQVSEEN
jgi:transcriptional antiterminator/mannitol/fructose-specific phosphotransferase system IIA component (Ntr-type)